MTNSDGGCESDEFSGESGGAGNVSDLNGEDGMSVPGVRVVSDDDAAGGPARRSIVQKYSVGNTGRWDE